MREALLRFRKAKPDLAVRQVHFVFWTFCRCFCLTVRLIGSTLCKLATKEPAKLVPVLPGETPPLSYMLGQSETNLIL